MKDVIYSLKQGQRVLAKIAGVYEGPATIFGQSPLMSGLEMYSLKCDDGKYRPCDRSDMIPLAPEEGANHARN